MYVGAGGDFGYLTPDAVGQLRFTSLLPIEARQDLRFNQVFTPISAPDGRVYFQSRTRMCRWSAGDEVRCQDTPPALSRIFVVGSRLYVQQQGVGLMEMVGDSMRPAPGGERFAREEIKVLLPYGDGEGEGLVVGLRTSELCVLRARSCEPFAPAIHDRRADERLTDGAVLPDGSFALATRLRGLLVVDRQGRLLHQIDRAAGLQDNYVHAVLTDRQGGLWLGLQTGASRVEVSSPFSVFSEASGLEQEWRAVLRHEGSLYVRGYAGLFEAPLPAAPATEPMKAGALRFRRVPEVESSVWSMLPIGDRLLVSSQNGIDEIRAKRPRRILSYASTPMTMYRSRTDPSRIYVGLANGLASFYLADGAWTDEGRMPGLDETITSIAETKTGTLWLISQRQRVLHVDLATSSTSRPWRLSERRPRIRLYPVGEAVTGRISIQEIAGRPVFLSEQRIAEFDERSGTFVAVPALTILSEAGRRSFSSIAEDRQGNLWVASRKPGGVDFLRRQPDGGYRLDNAGLRQVLAWSVYPEAHSDVVWLCTPDYLLRYDPSLRTRASRAFATLIRQVTADEHRVVYGGAPMSDGAADRAEAYRRPAFTYDTRSLQFEFAATAFDAAELNVYQSRLEGFDREWSPWSTAPSRVYTNLSPGDYRFVVRARDIHGQVSASSVYSFAVLPPWYYSRWAYALYGSIAVGVILLIRWFELKRSQARLGRERQSMELDKLRELDSLKSRFFADISHELRTPLTLIIAPRHQMIDEAGKPRVVQKLQLVRSHAEYLLRLIGQILDLSKLEARRMQLQASSGDLAQFVERGVASFAPAAEAGGIELGFRSTHDGQPGSGADAWFDRDVLEKILNNVISNALRFTPHGGTVSVALATGTGEDGGDAYAEIVVADTGVGIPRDRIPHIFDRFYQVDGARSREGIGIGLALVKELVELHAGTIAVESVEGRGTTFVIRLSTEQPQTEQTQTEKAQLEPDASVPAPALTRGESALVASPAILDAATAPALAAATDHDEDTVVLIVEDNTSVRQFVREQLDPYYRVLEAGNGAEGLELAVSSLPDLVLSDVSMPEMDGYELCRTLKHDKRTCHIPVVLLTARTGRADKLHGLDTGADSWLVKPFDSWELVVQVRNLIEQRRRLRERFSAPIVLKPSELGVTPMDEAFLEKVLAVVQANLAEPDFDVVRLGREVGLSRSQLHRKLRALTNQSPTLLIRSIRLQRAAELLQQKSGSIAEVAYGVGFSSQAYFAKCFREELGCSPKEYARGGGLRVADGCVAAPAAPAVAPSSRERSRRAASGAPV